jgi:hypothetical protein
MPLAFVLVSMLVMLFGTGCECNGPNGPTPTPWVKRLATVVYAGKPATNPPLLDHDNRQALSSGDGVTTDGTGEAEIHLGGCSATLYVFMDGDVTLQACRKTDPADVCNTNASVLVEATCAPEYSFDVDTRSCKVIVKSTAFSLTYLRSREISLVIALDDTVWVRPVVDRAEQTLGEQIPVKQGYFLHTIAGPQSPDIGGVRAREPVPISVLPRVVEELQQMDPRIVPWMFELTRRAGDRKLLPPEWPFDPEAPPPDVTSDVTLEMISGGGVLEDSFVQEALLLAIDKKMLVVEVFDDQRVDLRARLKGEEIDAYEIPFDRDRAKEQLAEAGLAEGFGVKIVCRADDEQLAKAAEWMAHFLSTVGIEAIPVPLPTSDIASFVEIAIAAGKPVVLLRRQ